MFKFIYKFVMVVLSTIFVAFAMLSANTSTINSPYSEMQERGYSLTYLVKKKELRWHKQIKGNVLTASLQVGKPLFSIGGHYYRFASLPSPSKFGVVLGDEDFLFLKKLVTHYEGQLLGYNAAQVKMQKIESATNKDSAKNIVVKNSGNQRREGSRSLQAERIDITNNISPPVGEANDTEALENNYEEDEQGRNISSLLNATTSKNWKFYQMFLADASKPLKLIDQKITSVIIDPGHGGKDPGAKAYGYEEKELNLLLAAALRKNLLQENPRLKVSLTRNSDRYLSLRERVTLANELAAENNALFVSLHHNIWFTSAARGLELYYLHHEPGVFSGTTEADAVKAMNHSLRGISEGELKRWKEIQQVFSWMTAVQYQEESILLADTVLREIQENVVQHKVARGVKSEVFFVLKGVLMPSLLIEGGFLSNPEDLKFLTTQLGRDQLAKSMAKGIVSYIKKFSASKGFTSEATSKTLEEHSF